MSRTKGMGGHQSSKMLNDEWITPKYILDALGKFDLDPCAAVNQPWQTADTQYTINDLGLQKEWEGRVWLNPPYGKEAYLWLTKLSLHKNGIALIFARTETEMFFKSVWPHAHGIFFIKGRLIFHYIDGSLASANSGAPSVLIAYDEYNSFVLQHTTIPGKFIKLK